MSHALMKLTEIYQKLFEYLNLERTTEKFKMGRFCATYNFSNERTNNGNNIYNADMKHAL